MEGKAKSQKPKTKRKVWGRGFLIRKGFSESNIGIKLKGKSQRGI
jgi:hypothetical protein